MIQSTRFGLPVVITEHARLRMTERNLSETLTLEIIDTGTLKEAGGSHHWIYKHLIDREDNLLCVAAVVDNAVEVKTVVNHGETQP